MKAVRIVLFARFTASLQRILDGSIFAILRSTDENTYNDKESQNVPMMSRIVIDILHKELLSKLRQERSISNQKAMKNIDWNI